MYTQEADRFEQNRSLSSLDRKVHTVLIAYVGFVQSGTIRSFNFEARPLSRPGRITKYVQYSMTADMTIMSRLRVKFQDLPALCLRTLSAAVCPLDESIKRPESFVLTEADVHEYCTSILAGSGRGEHRKRLRPKPTQNSQFHWPKKT